MRLYIHSPEALEEVDAVSEWTKVGCGIAVGITVGADELAGGLPLAGTEIGALPAWTAAWILVSIWSIMSPKVPVTAS